MTARAAATRAATSLESAPRPPSFGEEGGRLSYESYLRVSELLSLQRLLSDPPAHDELLFITIHQVYELWFKELLFELTSARELMEAGEARRALPLLRRVCAIERVLVAQIEVLESMSPQHFLEFRTDLAPASGFQSLQFREVEFLSGSRDERYLARLTSSEKDIARLGRRLQEPSLWDAFCALLERRGLPMPRHDGDARRRSLVAMAAHRDRFHDEYELSEALLDHDELFTLWRVRHVLMVERQIGTKTGTGGSSGSPYLRETLSKRFFPELWDLRSYLEEGRE